MMTSTATPPAAASAATAEWPATLDASAAYPGDLDALHTRLIGLFEESEHATYDARIESERARDYYDGRQWTAEEIAILRKRKQPAVVNNYVKRKIDLLRGIQRRGRADPRAYSRTPTEDARADAATQALRYVADDQRWEVVASLVSENLMIEGYGANEVIVEWDEVDQGYNIVLNHVAWDRTFYDAHSRHPGFTDASHMGIIIWQDYADALAMYPDAADKLDATLQWGSQTYADKPAHIWCDHKRKRVMTVQHQWKEGKNWWVGTYARGGWLEDPMKSPYPDRHGHGACSLHMRSCYIDRDGNRYGLVKDLISPQDAVNKRESRLINALNVNQVIASQGAVADVDAARREIAKPDGFIVVNPNSRFDVNRDQSEIGGHFQLLQHAIQQINVAGPNASMAGKDPRELSGRAIIAQQSGGMLEFEHVADAMRQHTRKVFEAVWMRVKQFWQSEKWIRVTDDEKNVKFIGLNHPVTLQDELQKMDPQKAQMIAQQMQLMPNDPRMQMVVKIENDLSDIDCDIDIEEAPDTPNLQIEQFQQIMQLPPEILQQFGPEFIIKASALRNKDDLVKILETNQQKQAAAQQSQQQFQMAMQHAQLAKTQADTAKTQADTAKVGVDSGLIDASTADKRAQAIERLHGVASEHADMAHQPVVPGVGAITPDLNPLLQPPPVQPQQGPTGP